MADALSLIEGGTATTIAQVSITRDPTGYMYGEEIIPVASWRLVAGSTPMGSVTAIGASSNGTDNPLPPGNYIVLLAPGGAANNYFLSDGLFGSFSLNGSAAQEQCPDYDHPDQTLLSTSGVQSKDGIISLLTTALNSQTGTPSSGTTETPTNTPS